MKLAAPLTKKSYKSEEEWLDAIYDNNKAEIDKALYNEKKPNANLRGKFKQLYYGYRETDGLSPTKAMKAFGNSTWFTSEGERGAENFKKGLQNFRAGKFSGWRQVRNKLRDWKTGKMMNITSVEYSTELKAYIYNGFLAVSWVNSPKGIKIWNMETNQVWEYFYEEEENGDEEFVTKTYELR